MSELSSIPTAIDAIRNGNFLIVVDDEDRENEGDIIMAAEFMTEKKMAFMIRYTGGVVCLPLSNEIANQLDLPPMIEHNNSKFGTAFTVTVEAKEGVTTGISAHDRAKTILAAANPVARPEDLRRPGHVFPLRAQDGGVLVRAGHTEATIDLCRLAGLRAAGVLSELMHDDGTMMRMPALQQFAKEHDIAIISISDLIAWKRKHETCIRLEAESNLDSETGAWKIRVYTDTVQNGEHVALIKGDIRADLPTLVRVHSECLTGDVFGSHFCDCGDQLHEAMQRIQKEGTGVILYLRQEGRGVGLANKIRAYALQDTGLDTVEANESLGLPNDVREYGIGAQILRDCDVGHMRLLTNNPKKMIGLDGYGLEIIEQISLELPPKSERQAKYLKTKKEKMGHILKQV